MWFLYSGGIMWTSSSMCETSSQTTKVKCSTCSVFSWDEVVHLLLNFHSLGSSDFFLPKCSDVTAVKSNLVVLVGSILTVRYTCFFLQGSSKVHQSYRYSPQMCKKSDVVVLDLLMKNESTRTCLISWQQCKTILGRITLTI